MKVAVYLPFAQTRCCTAHRVCGEGYL